MSAPRVHIAKSVASTIELYGDLVDERAWTRSVEEQLLLQSACLLAGHERRAPGAFVELSNWHPEFVGRSAEIVWAVKLSDEDTLHALAREHGYSAWEVVQSVGTTCPAVPFERAIEAILLGDLPNLTQLLDESPELVTTRSHWGHRATLLHYAAANGVETYRQRVPMNLVEVVGLLLGRGSDVNAEAEMYGGHQTVLGLLLTSSHPADAGVTSEVAHVLRVAGGRSGS